MRLVIFALLTLLCACRLAADEPRSGLKVTVLLENVDNPCGIAMRPLSPSELFLAESGAGRVLRVRLNGRASPTAVIEGFPCEEFGDGPRYNIGPLAVCFIDRTNVIVGEGGQPRGADRVRIYQLPEDGKPLRFDQSKQTLHATSASESSATGQSDFFAIAVSPISLFVSGNGSAEDWILKADLAGISTNRLARFIATKRDTGIGAPTALAMSKRGELVTAHTGDLGAARDSAICFYQAATGRRLLKMDTGLHDITGLAYAQSGLLYAIDFAWSDPSAGGLYRLDMALRGGRQSVKAVKLLPLDRPAGLAIASDRIMYVTTFGSSGMPEAAGGKMGQLLRIEKMDGNL